MCKVESIQHFIIVHGGSLNCWMEKGKDLESAALISIIAVTTKFTMGRGLKIRHYLERATSLLSLLGRFQYY